MMAVQDRALAELGSLPSGVPDAAEYALIRPFLLEPVPPEQLYVRRMALANDEYCRSDMRFPPEILARLAETLVGKPLLIGHDTSGLASGLFYRAHTRPALPGEAGTTTLEAWFYLLRTEANAEVRAQMDAGVARYCSIGYTWDRRLCDVCGCDYYGDCPHYRGQRLEDGRRVTLTYAGDLARYEAIEGSLVYLGRLRLAQLIKTAFFEEEGMDLDKLAARMTAIEETLARLETAAAGSSTAPTADSSDLAADGREYRAALRGQALHLVRILGAEADAQLWLDAMPAATAAQLKQLVEGYQKRVDERFPPQAVGSLTHAAPGGAPDDPEPAPGRRALRLS
jgi:hypothetical protein